MNVLIFVMSMAVMGVGHQEAFQILDNVSNTFYGIAYLFMFAIPLLGLKNSPDRPPRWLRAAALSGFAVTLLACVLSLFPIVDVKSWLSFGLKVGGVVLVANLIGAFVYVKRPRRVSNPERRT